MQINNRLLGIFLLGFLLCYGCRKEEASNSNPEDVLNQQLSSLEGRYFGVIQNWIVHGHDYPGDTIWSSYTDTFALQIGQDGQGAWSFQLRFGNPPSPAVFDHFKPEGSATGNPVYFRYKTSIDPVYGFSDGTAGGMTVWRNPAMVRGSFSHNPGPGRYGFLYEGHKVD
jgi:hypothetical protein